MEKGGDPSQKANIAPNLIYGGRQTIYHYSLCHMSMLWHKAYFKRRQWHRDQWVYSTTVTEFMMTSSNGNILCVTGPMWEESTGHRWIPSQRPVTQSFDIFFDLRLNKRLSKQSRRRLFETQSNHSLGLMSRFIWTKIFIINNFTDSFVHI